MATATWGTPTALSASLVTTELDSLANGSESSVFTHDNATAKDLYAAVTIKLGSLTPTAGGSVSLRVYISDGTNVSDKTGGGDVYTSPLTTSTGAKIVIFPMVRLYPFSLRLSITNNAGVAYNAADNDVYIRPYDEIIV